MSILLNMVYNASQKNCDVTKISHPNVFLSRAMWKLKSTFKLFLNAMPYSMLWIKAAISSNGTKTAC